MTLASAPVKPTAKLTAKLTGKAYIKARQKAKVILPHNHPEQPLIVSNIPPPGPDGRGGVRKFDRFYPLEKMKVGDSFWVESQTQCTTGALCKFAKRTGWKFVSRGQHEDGTPNRTGSKGKRGTRVWRVA